MSRWILLLPALWLGCSSTAPEPSSPSEPAPATSPGAQPTAKGPSGFASYREEWLDGWLAMNPSLGRQAGLHRYDGKVADYSADGLAARVAWLRAAQAKLAGFDREGLSPDEALDHAILTNRVELELFNAVERELARTNPAHYDELFSVSRYIDFDYAPLEERAERLVEHEEAALAQVDHVLANLRPVSSRPVVETAIEIFEGYADYLAGDVKRIVGGVGDAAFQARFRKSNDALAAKAAEIAKKLKSDVLPKADDKSHVLGKDRFLRFVRAQEGRDISLASFKAMAEEDLQRNKKAYETLAAEVKITRPEASRLLKAASDLVEQSRVFVVDKQLVTIPSEERAVVRETPPYMRWNAAFLNPPGPFDAAKKAFYYITLPDPSWPEKEQREYIFPWGTLMATTVHEVYPGHFLQGLWLRKAPTRVQKIIESYSFVEGWAHYTEQLMVEQGFGADEPQNRLGQLSDALLRNCRFVVSIGVHAESMSLARAAERFEKDCFQDKATARQQAVRATFDPGYFAYTVGKLQILELRQRLQAKLGDSFDLRRFHDALLSHGSPPVALIADRIQSELTE